MGCAVIEPGRSEFAQQGAAEITEHGDPGNERTGEVETPRGRVVMYRIAAVGGIIVGDDLARAVLLLGCHFRVPRIPDATV